MIAFSCVHCGQRMKITEADGSKKATCAKCKQSYDPPKAMKLIVQQMGLEINEFYRGVGCARCRNTGFTGRIAIHELLVVDDALRETINVSCTLQSITEHARRNGMIPLRYDGQQICHTGNAWSRPPWHAVADRLPQVAG